MESVVSLLCAIDQRRRIDLHFPDDWADEQHIILDARGIAIQGPRGGASLDRSIEDHAHVPAIRFPICKL